MAKKTTKSNLIIFDWISMVAFFTCKKLEKNHNRQFTFSEINDFRLTLTTIVHYRNLHLLLLREFKLKDEEFTLPYVSDDGYSGFSIKDGVSVEQIYEKYVSCVSEDALVLLNDAFEKYEKIFN